MLFKRTRNVGARMRKKAFSLSFLYVLKSRKNAENSHMFALVLVLHFHKQCTQKKDVLSHSTAVHLETKTQEGNMTPHTFSDHKGRRTRPQTLNATLLLSEGKWGVLLWMFLRLTHWAHTSHVTVLDIWHCSPEILIQQMTSNYMLM